MQIEKRCTFQRDSGTDFQAMKEALSDKNVRKTLIDNVQRKLRRKSFRRCLHDFQEMQTATDRWQ